MLESITTFITNDVRSHEDHRCAMILYVALYDESRVLRNEYWTDYTKREEQQRLIRKCADTFLDGWSVFMSPVTRYGEVPA